jgi:tol-pal system protein YbgF
MKSLIQSTTFCLAMMVTATTAMGQDRNLADIRTELGLLSSQIQGLRSELIGSGTAQSASSSGTALMRVDSIENELRVLTGQLEELQYRIEQIAKDATNRVGDLEFRLTELEGGDVSAIGKTRPIGGVPTTPTGTDGAELTVAEKADYDSALKALDAGDFSDAAQRFDAFATTYPGGPLTAGAQLYEGKALAGLGDWKSAGRSYLDSFSSAPTASTAPQALLGLGVSLGKLGKTSEACQTLSEVATRFPSDPVVEQSTGEMGILGCS